MSTRAQVRFATREAGQSFNKHPDAIHAQFYVHHDGYPEGLGVDIAQSIECNGNDLTGWEIEELYHTHGDVEYIYYVWQAMGKETYVSIFEVGSYKEACDYCDQVTKHEDKCIFVGTPLELINKYEYNDR